MTFKQIDVALAGTARAAREAREALKAMKALVAPDTFEDLRLLVSELVANSVRHAGSVGQRGYVRLKVFASEKLVRVEVTDEGAGFDQSALRNPSPEDPSGRGLYLVDQLAKSWGVTGNGGTCVWFVLAA
jgi:anti-sigma regulatory factor (Ser/Thr protein kinase)